MDNWTAPKYIFMPHTIVLGGSQFTHSIPLFKREAKLKNQAGFFVFDKFTLQVNLDKSGGVLISLLNILFILTSEVNSTMRRCFLSYRMRTEFVLFCAI